MTKAKQATTIASASIDYDKYSNMTTSQLLNSLESAKKKARKIPNPSKQCKCTY